MERPTVVHACVALAAVVGITLSGTRITPGEQAAAQDLLGVPVGGVILWWGLLDEIPENFEICDGRVPQTSEPTLKVKKPDLRGRFPLGAPNEFQFRPWDDNTGGSDQRALSTGPATIDEPPEHAHAMPHTHASNAHSHPMPHVHQGGIHTHSLNSHTHAVSPHDHPMDHHHAIPGEWEELEFLPPAKAGDGITRTFLVKVDRCADCVATGGPLDSKGKSVVNTGSGGGGDTGGPSPARTGTDGAIATGPANPANTSSAGAGSTGAPDPGSTASEGASTSHVHPLEIKDIRPSFTQFLYIIRVK